MIKNGDVLEHRLHRHEPPVSAQPIKIVKQTDEYVVVDKPASLPVCKSCVTELWLKSLLTMEHTLYLWDFFSSVNYQQIDEIAYILGYD